MLSSAAAASSAARVRPFVHPTNWSLQHVAQKTVIFFHGCIGAGKTTVIKHIEQRVNHDVRKDSTSPRRTLMVLNEVDSKKQDESNIITAFYNGNIRRLGFQIFCAGKYAQNQARIQAAVGHNEFGPDVDEEKMKSPAPWMIVSDRSMADTSAFAENLEPEPLKFTQDEEGMTENDLLRSLTSYGYESAYRIKRILHNKGYRVVSLFVDVDDKTIAERVVARGRAGEMDMFKYNALSGPDAVHSTVGARLNRGLRNSFRSNNVGHSPDWEHYLLRNDTMDVEMLCGLMHGLIFNPHTVNMTVPSLDLDEAEWTRVHPWHQAGWKILTVPKKKPEPVRFPFIRPVIYPDGSVYTVKSNAAAAAAAPAESSSPPPPSPSAAAAPTKRKALMAMSAEPPAEKKASLPSSTPAAAEQAAEDAHDDGDKKDEGRD